MKARVHTVQTQYFADHVVVHGTCVREVVAEGETVSLGNCHVERRFERAAYDAMTGKAIHQAVVAEVLKKAAEPKSDEGLKKFAGLTIS